MNKVDILHIYAGTGGAAGTYIDGIFSSLEGKFKQECIVNYYFPFNYGKKIFYKVTEMSGKNKLSNFPRLRLVFRMMELVEALFFSLLYVFKLKPKVVNYSMTSNLKVEYLFLKIIKKYSRSVLIITCHDVIPFKTSYSNHETDVNKRKAFFNIADYLLVHNESSRKTLIKYFEIDGANILEHRFPVMDLNKIEQKRKKGIKKPNTTKILFVGHMRKEKGVELLVDAWSKNAYKNLHLTIAGNVPQGFNFDFSSIESENFTLVDRFLSDVDFVELIISSDFVILPYTNGTNSGFPGSIISLGAIPATSDIPIFNNNPLISKEFIFKSEDKGSLISQLEYISKLSIDEVEIAKEKFKISLDAYALDFNEEINCVYQHIITSIKW